LSGVKAFETSIGKTTEARQKVPSEPKRVSRRGARGEGAVVGKGRKRSQGGNKYKTGHDRI